MISFDNYLNENKTEHNKNWPYIPDHPYRILIAGGSGSGKIIIKFNRKPTRDKIYLYVMIKYICILKIRMKQNINI